MGEGVRRWRSRLALVLGAVRGGHRSGRLPDRPGALGEARRLHYRRARRGQPDADLVLAGGTRLRPVGFLSGAVPAVLCEGVAHSGKPRPNPLGADLGAGALYPLLRFLRRLGRGRLAADRVSLELAPGHSAGCRRRRSRAGAGASDLDPGQSGTHRLDPPHPAAHPYLGRRGGLPDRRDRQCDRRAAADPLRPDPGFADRPRVPPCCDARNAAGEAWGGARRRRWRWGLAAAARALPWSARTTSSLATSCPPSFRLASSPRSGSPPVGLAGSDWASRWLSVPTGWPSTFSSPRPRACRSSTIARSSSGSARRTCRARSSPGKSVSTRSITILSDGAQRLSAGKLRVKEVDIISKPSTLAGRFVDVPSPFRLAGRFKTARITLSRYVSNRPITVSFHRLYHLQTGFGRNAVLIDGLPAQASVPRYAALDGGPRGSVPVGPASAQTRR